MKKAMGLLLAAALVFSLVACGGSVSGTPATGGNSASAPAETGEIVIGGLAPLTGGVSQYGIAAANGAKLAVKEINEAGGVLGRQIKFIVEDEKGDPIEAVTAYNKLVQNDKIVALVGDITTKPTIAVAQKAAQDGIPMITPTGTGAEITEIGSNIFRACFTDPYQGELMANYAKEKIGAKTVAILYDTGDDYSSGVADAFEETAIALGLEVVAKEGYETGSVDFNAQLSKISKDGNPDVIMAPCYYEDAAKILVQARNLGIDSVFLGPDGWDGVLGQINEGSFDALNKSFYCSQYPMKDPTPELKVFIDKYKVEFGEDVNMFGALGYEAMYLMVAAIEKANSTDSAAIVAAMKAIEYQGLVGAVSFKSGNNPVRDAYIIEFKDGKEVVLGGYNFQ